MKAILIGNAYDESTLNDLNSKLKGCSDIVFNEHINEYQRLIICQNITRKDKLEEIEKNTDV